MRQNEQLPLYKLDGTEKSNIQFELLDMTTLLASNGNHPFEAHLHGFYQIIWFKNGCGTHSVDFIDYPVHDNSMFFISPGQIHFFEKGSRQEGVILHFNESFLSDEGTSENVFLKYNVFNAFDTDPFFLITEADGRKLDGIVRSMDQEITNLELFAHRDYLKYLVKLFLIEVQRAGRRGGGGSMLSVNNSSHRTFIRFRQMLEHHYKQMHTVKEYASHLNVSVKTLTNSVYDSSHSTPLKIINDRIILEAKRQLFYSDLRIKEIAYSLGFEDPSYFVKFFKRQTGMLPTEFRESY